MYRIGEFAERAGVPPKTLRHYDEIDLLKPAAHSAASGYRLYSASQVDDVREIRRLKAVGLSLEEIRVVRERGTPLRVVLEEARRRLARSIAASRRELEAIDARLAAMNADEGIRVRTLRAESMLVATVRDRLADVEDAEELERELEASLPQSARDGERGVLWHGCGGDSGESIDAEAYRSVRAGTRARGRVRIVELPAVRCAAALAPCDDYEPAYAALRAWLGARGLALAGPKREIEVRDALTGAPLVDVLFPLDETFDA